MKTVTPSEASGFNMSLTQLWGSGPNWTITCGKCSMTFKERIPMVDNPGIRCPGCGAINVLPVKISYGA